MEFIDNDVMYIWPIEYFGFNFVNFVFDRVDTVPEHKNEQSNAARLDLMAMWTKTEWILIIFFVAQQN